MKRIVFVICSGFFLFLTGCSPELGKLPWEHDVDCLRKELNPPAHQSFQMAANFCQRNDHGNPVALNLRNAPDLQKAAKEANIAYIP